MNDINKYLELELRIEKFINKILYKKINLIFKAPSPVMYEKCEAMIALKRKGFYLDACFQYLDLIENEDVVSCEVIRWFVKVLCCLNCYRYALILLSECIKVGAYSYLEGIGVKVPSGCSMDYEKLEFPILMASIGNLSPLLERTRDLSGNPNYTFIREKNVIKHECEKLLLETLFK